MADAMQVSEISYEDLAIIEDDFEDIDMSIMRTQYQLQKPLYEKRQATIAKIPHFWPLVFEQAPLELDAYISVEDSRIFAEYLESIEVTRPELESDTAQGSPRSLRIAFNFKPNDTFSDSRLVKDFWYRRAKDGWTGLVSEPVRISWKKDKDLSHGLTELAYKLFDARKKSGNMLKKDLPEYTKLAKEIESWNARNTSFFTFFAWSSDRRYVTVEESNEALKIYNDLKKRRSNGEKVDMPAPAFGGDNQDDDENDPNDDADVEPMEDGEGLAVLIADELWPSAIKLFTNAQEVADMDSADFSEGSEDEDEDGPVDIRALVASRDGPPAKKQKQKH